AIRGVGDGNNHAGGCGDGEAHKILAVRPAGVFRARVGLDVETGEASDAAEQEQERDEVAGAHEMLAEKRERTAYEVNAPGEGEDGGREAESDGVGEGIHFAAEIADGVRHAGDAAVETVEYDRCADHFRRYFKVNVSAKTTGLRGDGSFKGFQDSHEPEEDISRSEHGGKGIGRAIGAPVRGTG